MYPPGKKSLGQHFLFDQNILKKIISACQLNQNDLVLEIGPGLGILTEELAKRAKKVMAVEIDKNLCELLKEKFKGQRKIKIIHSDILKFKIPKLNKKIKIIGNLPYYITSPIISHLLEQRRRIKEIYISAQKEFARRLIALPATKDYGSFSCYVQYYAKPSILFYIGKNAFRPIPQVASAFVKLAIYQNLPVRVKDEALFFQIIRLGFNQRRKMFKNNLKKLVSQAKISSAFKKLGLSSQVRAEELSLRDFANFSNLLTAKNK